MRGAFAFAVSGILCLSAAAALPGNVVAQRPVAANSDRARSLFEEGVRAAQRGRWGDALHAFTQSYELEPRPATLLNLAGARAETGALVEAAEAYRQFLRGLPSNVDARVRSQATSALEAVEARVGHIRIRVRGQQPDDQVTLDSSLVENSRLRDEIDVNPGSHRVVLERDGTELASVDVDVADGAHEEVLLQRRITTTPIGPDHPPPPPPPIDDNPPPERGGGGSVFEEPWFWIVVGAVIAGGIVTAVVVTQGGGGRQQSNPNDFDLGLITVR